VPAPDVNFAAGEKITCGIQGQLVRRPCARDVDLPPTSEMIAFVPEDKQSTENIVKIRPILCLWLMTPFSEEVFASATRQRQL